MARNSLQINNYKSWQFSNYQITKYQVSTIFLFNCYEYDSKNNVSCCEIIFFFLFNTFYKAESKLSFPWTHFFNVGWFNLRKKKYFTISNWHGFSTSIRFCSPWKLQNLYTICYILLCKSMFFHGNLYEQINDRLSQGWILQEYTISIITCFAGIRFYYLH